MQPTLVDDSPAGGDWLHEIKYDGYRTQLSIFSGEVRAYTRNGHDWTAKYPSIVQAAAVMDCQSALIDGEVCAQNELGVTDFSVLRSALTSDPGRLVFFAFDLLHLNGVDLRKRPLEERRAHLRWILEGTSNEHLLISDEYDGEGADFFKLVDQMGLEGVVSKRKGSTYTSGPTQAWLKTKCWHTDTFDVIGVDKGSDGIPYALLADEAGYRGAAFISLPASLRDVFWRYVESRGVAKAPIIGTGRKMATWIGPGLRATVRHLKGSDKLRHATVEAIEIEPGR
jgi:ATP-dependent DNA ligase